jgi:amino acid permease
MKNPVLLASLSMIGTIVGAGIFGLPYVFAQSGTPIALIYCVVLGTALLFTHWLYAKVAEATPGKHRLVGYVHKHLGRTAAEVVSITNPMNLLGSLLAYLILGGAFLSALFGGSPMVWGLVFFGAMSVLLILPFRRLEFIEGYLTWLLVAVAIIVIVLVAPHIKIENLLAIDAAKWFLPYGVVFFSFGGLSVVPDIVESLNKNMKKVARAIVVGTIASIVISVAFAVAISGATGSATSQDAIGALVPVVGGAIVALGAVFGLLAVATSFITICENVKDQFRFDFKLSKIAAWGAAVGLPLAAYLFGARDFVGVIGFVGAVFGVIDGALIALMACRFVKGRLRLFIFPLIVVFAVGLASEIFNIFK